MAHPEGYAKAIRLLDLAERFGFPVLTLIDTPGAYPGVAAEQHGQGGAIARTQARMVSLARAVGCLRDRRGRVGRRGRPRRLRPRADAGERDLLGDHARGLRGHPLARRRRGEEGGSRVQARCEALPGARRDRRDRPRAARRRAERPRRRRGGAAGEPRHGAARARGCPAGGAAAPPAAPSSGRWGSTPEVSAVRLRSISPQFPQGFQRVKHRASPDAEAHHSVGSDATPVRWSVLFGSPRRGGPNVDRARPGPARHNGRGDGLARHVPAQARPHEDAGAVRRRRRLRRRRSSSSSATRRAGSTTTSVSNAAARSPRGLCPRASRSSRGSARSPSTSRTTRSTTRPSRGRSPRASTAAGRSRSGITAPTSCSRRSATAS